MRSGTSLLWFAFLLGTVCSRVLSAGAGFIDKNRDTTPPFFNVDGVHSQSAVYLAYEDDEAWADKCFKGKRIHLCDEVAPKVHTEPGGEKYIVAWGFRDPGIPRDYREAIRCYLYRPSDPVLEHLVPGSVQYSVKGICMGKINGVVVFRKCYLVANRFEGANW